MRRWVCIIGLLTGFAGDHYVWRARPREPVPVERPIEGLHARDRRGLPTTADWWLRS